MKWTIQADLLATADLSLKIREIDGIISDKPLERWTPVDLLIGSVAGCFVKSCAMIMEAQGERVGDMRALVRGVKSTDKPQRVASLEIQYELFGVTPDRAKRIAAQAKKICTVTNSLNCEIQVVD